MTTITMTVEEMVARRVYIVEQIDQLTDEKKQIDSALLEDREAGTYPAGDWTLQIKAGARRLNNDRFTQRFPVAQYPMYYKPAVDTKAISEFFAPADLEAFYDRSASSIAVK